MCVLVFVLDLNLARYKERRTLYQNVENKMDIANLIIGIDDPLYNHFVVS